MKISEIRLYHLEAMLPEPIGNALVSFPKRETLLVEVVAGDLSGWGEAWLSPLTAAAVIEIQLAKHVLGRDPRHALSIWRDMRRGTEGDTAATGIAAIDMALHDLAARAHGVPLSTLLGGAKRDRVPAYASGPFFKPGGHPYRDFEREIAGYLKDGFRAIKLRIGHGVEDDVKIILQTRKAIGDERDLMVDFNQSCSIRRAIATIERVSDARLLWVEEPTRPDDIAGYGVAAGHLTPAIAGGETFTKAATFLPLLSKGSLDVLQPDLAICCGFSGVQQVQALAEIHERPLIPHVWGSTINFHAALQLTATLPAHRGGGHASFPFMEYDVGPNPLLDLCGRPALDGDGCVVVPDGNGIGISPTKEQLQPFIRMHRSIR